VATVIKLKRGTSTPTTSNLASGEVAIDTAAQKFYINDSGTIKEVGGSIGNFDNHTDVSFTDLQTGDTLFYNGTIWTNQGVTTKVIPFTKSDASTTEITLLNNTTATTINVFLDGVVNPIYYLPFVKSDGTSVQTLIPG
jgi:hypothetical protein